MEESSKEKIRRTLPYHKRLFILMLAFSCVIVACFVAFQYGRERLFKAEKLNNRLQMFNLSLIDAIGDGELELDTASTGTTTIAAVSRYWQENSVIPLEKGNIDSLLRVTVITTAGRVIYDNSLDTLPRDNHLTRPEIADAIKQGTGYAVRRHSETTGDTYFYSAMHSDSIVVRSAVPYSLPLQEMLAADRGFLWFMLAITLVISIAAYFATRRLGNTITRLNHFAQKAERGEQIYDDEAFPHDELGDISNHIVRLYARLQKATESLHREHQRSLYEEREKIRIKKQLTNNINHELKTPVAAIQVCLETLLEHPDLPADKRQTFIQRCYANSERLCSLLNDVSTITRMDEASQLIEKEPLRLRQLITDTVDEYSMRLDSSGISSHVEFDDDIVINGNKQLLESVFRNLIDNAIAYANCHNIYIQLLDNTAELCRLSFTDDGTGVDEKHLPHLFERFYRVDKGRSRKLGGTGLGLSIVKNAVELHGGTISVANRPEGGLVFVFTLSKEKEA